MEYVRRIRRNSILSARDEIKNQISKREEAMIKQLDKEYKKLKELIDQRWDAFVMCEMKQ